VSNAPVAVLVAVWAVLSSLVKVSFVPAATVIVGGLKAKFLIASLTAPALGASVAADEFVVAEAFVVAEEATGPALDAG
jgi:hypothetical protein